MREFDVVCLTCGEVVTIVPIDYGNGYVALCPECKKLAYSEHNLPTKGGEIISRD
jgi:hypothetical protein